MTEDLVVATPLHPPTLFDMTPAAMVKNAAEMADALAGVIQKQKLYSDIQGKKFVKLEGWATLGTMLGVFPREVYVKELEDHSYEACVELFSTRSGQVMGRASAVCGVDERRWGGAERYARRSMAVTRATSKAYRLGFAWIMALAGYEATPEEEMPKTEFDEASRQALAISFELADVPRADWPSLAETCKVRPAKEWPGLVKQYKDRHAAQAATQ